MNDHRTRAQRLQDDFGQACLNLDRTQTALRWAREDGLPLDLFAAQVRARLDLWREAFDAFAALPDAERATVGLRSPITL